MNNNLKLQEEFQYLQGGIGERNSIPDTKTRKLRLKLALEELGELAEALGMEASFIELKETQSHKTMMKFMNKGETEVIDTEIYNPKEVADAGVDIEIINNGNIISFGQHYTHNENYINTHLKNMEKFPITKEIAEKILDDLTTENSEEAFTMHEVKDLSGEVRYKILDSSGKVRKSIYFEPAEMIL